MKKIKHKIWTEVEGIKGIHYIIDVDVFSYSIVKDEKRIMTIVLRPIVKSVKAPTTAYLNLKHKDIIIYQGVEVSNDYVDNVKKYLSAIRHQDNKNFHDMISDLRNLIDYKPIDKALESITIDNFVKKL